MSNELIMVIAILVASIAGVFTYEGLKYWKMRGWRFIKTAKKNGCCTVGAYKESEVVLEPENDGGAAPQKKTLKVIYEYEVGNTLYYKEIRFNSDGQVCADFPVQVMVYYDVKNPHTAICPEEVTEGVSVYSRRIAVIIAITITTFVVFHILKFLFGS